jgi:hypothetical protein
MPNYFADAMDACKSMNLTHEQSGGVMRSSSANSSVVDKPNYLSDALDSCNSMNLTHEQSGGVMRCSSTACRVVDKPNYLPDAMDACKSMNLTHEQSLEGPEVQQCGYVRGRHAELFCRCHGRLQEHEFNARAVGGGS